MISLARYKELLAIPGMASTFATSMLGRLPIGVTGLAILLLMQGASASFVQGGAAAACYVTGLALVAPLLGRAIDRRGPRLVLLACAFAFPAALVLLIAASANRDLAWLAFVAAAGAGATFPPITVCMRTYFRRVVREEGLLAAAFSAESVMIEIIFIVGPLLVALFIGFASAAMAVAFAAACGFAGTLLFLRSPALRGWRIEMRTSRSLLGPLVERRFVHLVAIVLCFASGFGFLEIGITGYALDRADAAFAGVLLGIMSAGSALGGIAYGSRAWHFPLARQFAAALLLTAAGLAVLALRWEPWALAAWSFFAGVAIAPALIIQSMLVTKAARAEHATEAFTWTTSALLAGVGIGLALGGALLEIFPPASALAAGAVVSLAAGLAARLLLGR